MNLTDLVARRRRTTQSCPWAEDGVCTLDGLHVGCTACLHRVTCNPVVARRLADMGIVPGIELTVLQRGGGPMLVAVGDARIALGHRVTRDLHMAAPDGATEQGRS